MAQTSIHSFFAPLSVTKDGGKKRIREAGDTTTQRKSPRLSTEEAAPATTGEIQRVSANDDVIQTTPNPASTERRADALTTTKETSKPLKAYTDLPFKDPIKHSVGKTIVWEGIRCAPEDREERRECNDEYLKATGEREATSEIDKVVQDLQQKLEVGKQCPLRNIHAGAWYLSCPEYFEQYLGWEDHWPCLQVSPQLVFEREEEGEEGRRDQVFAEINITQDFAPFGQVTEPFDVPAFASLDPLVFDCKGGYKIWFLGHGFLRMEQDVEAFTGRPGKLMWDGIQSVPSKGKIKRMYTRREAN